MLYSHLLLILYITLLSLYHMHVTYMYTDYTWYMRRFLARNYILTEYYGMLRFQPVGTPKLLDQSL